METEERALDGTKSGSGEEMTTVVGEFRVGGTEDGTAMMVTGVGFRF